MTYRLDAWYLYQCAALHHSIAVIALNQHTHPLFSRDPDGTPICPKGLRMQPTSQFDHTNGYRAQRFRCPLLFPESTGERCNHAQFAKGPGCVKVVNWELGGQMRVTLDRDGPLALGIERSKVRNGHSVANLNTLIYLIVNVKTLAKAKSINRGLLQMN